MNFVILLLMIIWPNIFYINHEICYFVIGNHDPIYFILYFVIDEHAQHISGPTLSGLDLYEKARPSEGSAYVEGHGPRTAQPMPEGWAFEGLGLCWRIRPLKDLAYMEGRGPPMNRLGVHCMREEGEPSMDATLKKFSISVV